MGAQTWKTKPHICGALAPRKVWVGYQGVLQEALYLFVYALVVHALSIVGAPVGRFAAMALYAFRDCLVAFPFQIFGLGTVGPNLRVRRLTLARSRRGFGVSVVGMILPATPLPATLKRQRKSVPSTQLTMFETQTAPQSTRGKVKKDYHVVHSRRGGWDVLKEGAKRVSGHFDTKLKATERGRELATRFKVELIVHDKSGKILERSKHMAGP